MSKQSNLQWSSVKGRLMRLDKKGLLGLTKDLFDLSPENREFLSARFTPEGTGGHQPIAKYRLRIKAAFNETDEHIKFGPIRKALREYRKATSDIGGTLDLTLFALELGTDFTNEYGDIDGPYYDSLLTLLEEFRCLIVSPENRNLYPMFEERLTQLQADANGIGWGYGDGVDEVVQELQCALSDPSQLKK